MSLSRRASSAAAAEFRPASDAKPASSRRAAPTNWRALWFKLDEELFGEYIGMRAGQRIPGTQDVDWVFLSHADFDGQAGLVQIFRERSLSPVTGPGTQTGRSRPSWLARAKAVLRIIAKKPEPAAGWKTFDPSWTPPAGGLGAGTALATHSFDAKTTARVAARARELGASTNSLLLATLARASEPYIDGGPMTWQMPVSMRGFVKLKNTAATHTGYVLVQTPRGGTTAETHERIKQAFRQLDHWAYWILLDIGRLVGRAGMRRIYLHHCRQMQGRLAVGIFSNLGSWDGVGEWFVCTPITKACPLGAGVITCDGVLAMSIEAHPSISRDSAMPQALMDRWVDHIMSELEPA